MLQFLHALRMVECPKTKQRSKVLSLLLDYWQQGLMTLKAYGGHRRQHEGTKAIAIPGNWNMNLNPKPLSSNLNDDLSRAWMPRSPECCVWSSRLCEGCLQEKKWHGILRRENRGPLVGLPPPPPPQLFTSVCTILRSFLCASRGLPRSITQAHSCIL